MFTCGGRVVSQTIISATSSAVSRRIPYVDWLVLYDCRAEVADHCPAPNLREEEKPPGRCASSSKSS